MIKEENFQSTETARQNDADNLQKTYVLSVLVDNHAGVLSRIAGLFTRRTYNIDSLSVGETENADISRMTIVTRTDEDTYVQIKKQLSKLQEVREISELSGDNAVLREHVLVKVVGADRAEMLQICEIYRARVVDISPSSAIIELTGGPRKINSFIEMMKQYNIVKLVRTGLTGLER